MTPELVIVSIIVLVFSVIAHEVAHGYMALRQGDPTAKLMGRLTLNPLKHLDPIGSFAVPLLLYMFNAPMLGWAKPVPYNPYNLKNQRWGEMYVAIAGPLINLAIAVLFGVIVKLVGSNIGASGIDVITIIIYSNISLAVFNMCPIPPLDGYKVFKAIFADNRHSKLTLFMERYSIAILLFFVFFLSQFFEPVVRSLFNLILN